ncbi:DNA circularization N-terminal domain-containing protein [Escherichia coli]
MFEDALNALMLSGIKPVEQENNRQGTFRNVPFSSSRSKNRLADVVWLNVSTRDTAVVNDLGGKSRLRTFSAAF